MTKILVFGSNGLVGSNILKYFSKKGKYELYSAYFSHPTNFSFCKNISIDVTDINAVMSLKSISPDIIINCAGITQISFCEEHPEIAREVNVNGAKNIALLSKVCTSKLVYMSSDVVYGGLNKRYNETDSPSPLNVYGLTKLEGENISLKVNSETLVLRNNVLFGRNIFPNRPSFVESILTALNANKSYNAFADAIFCPLYIQTMSEYLLKLLEQKQSGIFNMCCSESLSKYEFARLIALEFGKDAELILPASLDSVSKDVNMSKILSINNEKLLLALGIESTIPIKDMIKLFKKEVDAENGKNS
ncbi:MAG TPA: SDR family oxidoreductase [Candidatus Woesearchaeota archaeon]|nr:SDR family oxidoreductase [Candidatus Woesearchaeota archaeon]